MVFGEIIEVATFRANVDDGSGDRQVVDGGRLLRDNVYGTIEDDAVRRDFTANALYYDIADFSVRDYVGGFEDVNNRVLRLIGDPEARYREDPVRMLRAVRLSAKLGFRIDPGTAQPLPRLAPLLAEAAPARLFEECLKMFLAGHAEQSFEGSTAMACLPVLFPETAAALAAKPQRGAAADAALEGLRLSTSGWRARSRCRRRSCSRCSCVAGLLPHPDGPAGAGTSRGRGRAPRRRPGHPAPA